MSHFQVLSRHLPVHQNYLLEASAGTGKTFSIQNIVVRLLIETSGDEEPLSLEQILVVTFTKAATRDLKVRIRSNIESALLSLRQWQREREIPQETLDYLKAFMERGEEAVQEACRRLQTALFAFDSAPIYTIHAFCSKMLRHYSMESDMSPGRPAEDESLSYTEVMGVIRDYFRTGVRLESYSPAQIDCLLREDPEQRKLLRYVLSMHALPSLPPFKKVYLSICETLSRLKKELSLSAEKMIEDFKAEAPHFRNHKGAESKNKTLEQIEWFAHLFDRDEWSAEEIDALIDRGLVWTKALDPLLRKKKEGEKKPLHYPALTERLKGYLEAEISQAGDFSHLLARLSSDCRRLLRRYKREEEKLSFDDQLIRMDEAVSSAPFLAKVRAHFKAAIIDEFQDTDPLQWRIFKRLFFSSDPKWAGLLYLVGDPKQSIYSFRQADIYTYLEAANAMGEEQRSFLSVNYRSEPPLVNALNTLFSDKCLPRFIPLPRLTSCLAYQSVASPQGKASLPFLERRGAIHFAVADASLLRKATMADVEEKIFFPFIAQEIETIREKHHFNYAQFAVLVRDRHQAARLADYFAVRGIPFLNQRSQSLVESPAYQALLDLVRAAQHSSDLSVVRALFGGALFRWKPEALKNSVEMEKGVLFVHSLSKTLSQKGFASFFQEALETVCPGGERTLLQEILLFEGGLQFYRDLRQLADLVILKQGVEWHTGEGVVPFLDTLHLLELNDDPAVARFQDPSSDGVKILTLHFSKGLEFDVVFAVGLVNRSSAKDDLISVATDAGAALMPVDKGDERHRHFCREGDAEKMRQLYVAMTRAKKQLYVPLILHFPSEKLEFGEASPIELFAARAGLPTEIDEEDLYARIKEGSYAEFLRFLEGVGKEREITTSMHSGDVAEFKIQDRVERKERWQAAPLLHPPLRVDIKKSFQSLTSFTQLSYKRELVFSEREAAPQDMKAVEKTVHTIPASRETGILIHQLMEKFDFSSLSKQDGEGCLRSFVYAFLKGHPLQGWEEVVVQLIYQTLTSPIPGLEGEFCLSEIAPSSIYKEMPFAFSSSGEWAVEDIVSHDGIVKGVIDALVCHRGLYYLFDWKTNWLGKDLSFYHERALKLVMEENDYFLQAALYREAVRRYLAVVDPRPFESCFGGVFYLFMRGMPKALQRH